MTPTTANHLNTYLVSPTHPILLRTVQLSDVAIHAALLSDPANGRDPNSPQTKERSREELVGKCRNANVPTVLGAEGRPQSRPPRLNMVVCLPSDVGGTEERVVGLCGYSAIKVWERDRRKVRAGDAGVLLDSSVWGRGYAVEAMRLAIECVRRIGVTHTLASDVSPVWACALHAISTRAEPEEDQQ